MRTVTMAMTLGAALALLVGCTPTQPGDPRAALDDATSAVYRSTPYDLLLDEEGTGAQTFTLPASERSRISVFVTCVPTVDAVIEWGGFRASSACGEAVGFSGSGARGDADSIILTIPADARFHLVAIAE